MDVNLMMSPAEMAVVQRRVDGYNAELKARGLAPERDMGQDKYLKLLITQLRYQDPHNPLQNHEFAAQMAQFSTLEQMTKMNGSMEKFINSARLGESYAMLGKEVSWYDIDTRGLNSGIVNAIVLTDNHPMLRVGRIDIDPAEIVGVRIPEAHAAQAYAHAGQGAFTRAGREYEAHARMAMPESEVLFDSAEDTSLPVVEVP
jgi:flagellar basal-body rod modification protein FlgD